MLRDTNLSTEELDLIRGSIADLKSTDLNKRKQRLVNSRIVGVTCAAATFPILDNQEFRIVFLDECSQMLEPLSFIPINRFKCRYLLAAGDPMQLPPTLSNFSENEEEGLGKTLFVRLANLGISPIMLRTQYRVSATTFNLLFYFCCR